MKTKSQVFKKQALNSFELESVLGGKRQELQTMYGMLTANNRGNFGESQNIWY